MNRKFYTYIITNPGRSVFYTGVTNDLIQRILEHYLNRGQSKTFAGRYHCYWLVFYEEFKYVRNAIDREKEIKSWSRKKKIRLIESFNPNWDELNIELFGIWPPLEADSAHRGTF